MKSNEAERNAREALDAHVQRIVKIHFSPNTGTPFWIDWAKEAGRNPMEEIRSFDDLRSFPHFDGTRLSSEPLDRWVPAHRSELPPHVFQTGGTTGAPKERPSWTDHEHDYAALATDLPDGLFPRDAHWLMLGPTGPRRLRLGLEHTARLRGGPCHHVDLDPRWVRSLVRGGDDETADRYLDHVIAQARAILERHPIRCLFTTPRLLEALGGAMEFADTDIRGVLCGGTSLSPETGRFLAEEILGGGIGLVPIYGNTLMGLATSAPLSAENGYEVTYHAPQPRAVLRVVDPDNPDEVVDQGDWGRVELTTLTEEFFLPRLLERDAAIRRGPTEDRPWDGVGNVRPLDATRSGASEGVY